MQKAYIVNALRTPIARADGVFNFVRPDDLLSRVLAGLLAKIPDIDKNLIDDVIIGCAMPEAEQGLNIARNALLLAGYPQKVAGVSVNRFCASGLQAISLAADRVRLGEADIIIAGGVESMSMVPMTGNKIRFNTRVFNDDNIGIAFGMGLTAEEVANKYAISRTHQDEFALNSHHKAIAAIDNGYFKDEILAVDAGYKSYDTNNNCLKQNPNLLLVDNGARYDTNLEKLSKLKPIFAKNGSVTAGNSSQRSDGAAAVFVCNEAILTKFNLTPMAEFVGFSVSGVDPKLMGIGPIIAIPKVLKQCNLTLDDMDLIELNEAFAAQSLAVIDTLGLNIDKVNPTGGAIALGHPLGATGAVLTTRALHTLARHKLKYAMITMCIGTGMGAAGIIKRI